MYNCFCKNTCLCGDSFLSGCRLCSHFGGLFRNNKKDFSDNIWNRDPSIHTGVKSAIIRVERSLKREENAEETNTVQCSVLQVDRYGGKLYELGFELLTHQKFHWAYWPKILLKWNLRNPGVLWVERQFVLQNWYWKTVTLKTNYVDE